ncbi:Tim44 domain-containing protein [Herminiimonas sp. CN]|uniref:Tim44 domain-containing protein n=1 Tax=Herminiimonas sp. CN TaxID=1349818 RepID=UPI0004743412|nr:Tim44-like domain-containing protein [Herminiimonas sp. CN]
MKKILLAIVMVASTLTLAVPQAEARRMGGGSSSFGKQSSNVTRKAPVQQSQATNTAKPAAAPGAAAPAVKPASPWKGILGGALLGLGLGALLSHFGMGGALASMISTMLMVALFAMAAMFIYRLWMRNKSGTGNAGSQPAFAGAYHAGNSTPDIGSRINPAQAQSAALQSAPFASGSSTAAADAATWSIPSDFDVPGFLRHTKTYFIRLQAAWDRADTNDIREFTTPEMFGELKLQLQERGATPNVTDVVTLDAELLGIETTGNEYLASVKFSGMIKESEHAPAEPFNEVWNLSKPLSGQSGWVLAGIQQLS